MFSLIGCSIGNVSDNSIPKGYRKYVDSNGWSIFYPSTWDKVEKTFIQESTSGQTLQFRSEEISEVDLLYWIDTEINRKLSVEEGQNSIFEPLRVEARDDLEVYEYTIQSDRDGITYLLKTTIFYDGNRKYEFWGALPQIDGEIYEEIINSFKINI